MHLSPAIKVFHGKFGRIFYVLDVDSQAKAVLLYPVDKNGEMATSYWCSISEVTITNYGAVSRE